MIAAEETSISAGLEEERRLYELAMATEDRVEGMKAFLEKRKPRFEGAVSIERVGVLGAGTMGSGIAQLACLGGYETLLQDPDSSRIGGRCRTGSGVAGQGGAARDVERRGGRGSGERLKRAAAS